jgi:putative glutamine amidotransferase
MITKKPRIGISMRLEIETNRFYLGRDYCEALEHFGAIPVHFGLIPKQGYIRELVEQTDGILLPGSNTDVDPEMFGEEPHHKFGRSIPVKDETDRLILEEAERLGKPVLAICFGMQILNVYRGGTLYQDINSQIRGSLKHDQGQPLDRNSHTINISKGSWISEYVSGDHIKVNSHHHQSVKTPGENLRVSATAKDGVIESIEDTRENRFAVGVQWHPELSWKWDELSKQIFKVFVEECRK